MATATKKSAAKKTASSDPLKELVATFVELIKDGSLDEIYLRKVDDAITKRLEAHVNGAASASQPAASSEKSVPLPTRKSKEAPAAVPVKTVEPKVNALYTIAGEKYAGVVVKFKKWAHGDASLGKAGVEVVTEGPGYPKGKKFVIPVTALREKASKRRAGVPAKEITPAKKTTAKKTAPAKKGASASKVPSKKVSNATPGAPTRITSAKKSTAKKTAKGKK